MVKIKVSELRVDYKVYPRMRVDQDHVSRIHTAMLTGVEFPPIIVCKKTRRIVDGAHRTKAVEQMTSGRGEISCIEKTYATEQEFFLDAIRYNAGHGLVLCNSDRQRVMEMALELKVDPSLAAAAMNMSVRSAGALRTVAVPEEIKRPRSGFHQPKTNRFRHLERFREEAAGDLPEKRDILDEDDEEIQVDEAEIKLARVTDALPLANQLISFLENEDIDVENVELMTALKRLSEVLVNLDLQAAAG